MRKIKAIFPWILLSSLAILCVCEEETPTKTSTGSLSYDVIFSDDCENGITKWIFQNWIVDDSNYFTPSHSFAVEQGANTNASIKSLDLTVGGKADVKISYWHIFDKTLDKDERLLFKAISVPDPYEQLLYSEEFPDSLQNWEQVTIEFTTSHDFYLYYYVESSDSISAQWNIDNITVSRRLISKSIDH